MIDASVVIETVNARREMRPGDSLADAVAPVLAAVRSQTLPPDRYEILLVLDRGAGEAEIAELESRYPDVRLVTNVAPNYFAQKNAGAAAARGAIVACMDSDCTPDRAWLESILVPFASGADVVTGLTRYEGNRSGARTLSIAAFGSAYGARGSASAIILNNCAFRREVALRFPLDERIRRNGGCDAWRLHLLAAGARLVYEPAARNTHGFDGPGIGYLRKHFNRGYDSVSVYRMDDRTVLRGTRLFRRLGPIALAAITAGRVVVDWRQLLRYRVQLGISTITVPFYAALMTVTRAIELCGGVTATFTDRKR